MSTMTPILIKDLYPHREVFYTWESISGGLTARSSCGVLGQTWGEVWAVRNGKHAAYWVGGRGGSGVVELGRDYETPEAAQAVIDTMMKNLVWSW